MAEFIVSEGNLNEFHINAEMRLVRGYGPEMRNTPVLKFVVDTTRKRGWIRLETPHELDAADVLSEVASSRARGANTLICAPDVAERAREQFRSASWSINPKGCDLNLVARYGRRIRSIMRKVTRWEHEGGRLYHLSTWNELLQDIGHVVFPLELPTEQRREHASLVDKLDEKLAEFEPDAPLRPKSAPVSVSPVGLLKVQNSPATPVSGDAFTSLQRAALDALMDAFRQNRISNRRCLKLLTEWRGLIDA